MNRYVIFSEDKYKLLTSNLTEIRSILTCEYEHSSNGMNSDYI